MELLTPAQKAWTVAETTCCERCRAAAHWDWATPEHSTGTWLKTLLFSRGDEVQHSFFCFACRNFLLEGGTCETELSLFPGDELAAYFSNAPSRRAVLQACGQPYWEKPPKTH